MLVSEFCAQAATSTVARVAIIIAGKRVPMSDANYTQVLKTQHLFTEPLVRAFGTVHLYLCVDSNKSHRPLDKWGTIPTQKVWVHEVPGPRDRFMPKRNYQAARLSRCFATFKNYTQAQGCHLGSRFRSNTVFVRPFAKITHTVHK